MDKKTPYGNLLTTFAPSLVGSTAYNMLFNRRDSGYGIDISTNPKQHLAKEIKFKYRDPGSMVMTKKKKRSTPYSKRKPRTISRKQLMQAAPAKHWCINNIAALTHSTIWTLNLCGGINHGSTYNQRVGDNIYLEALKFSMSFQSPTTTPGICYRVILGYSGEELNPTSNFDSTNTFTANELFFPGTTGYWTPLGMINSKSFQVVYDKKWSVNAMADGVNETLDIYESIPLKKDFNYQAANSIYEKNKNLYLVVVSSIIGGTVGTTSTGTLVYSTDLIYKN